MGNSCYSLKTAFNYADKRPIELGVKEVNVCYRYYYK
jgi:hypothetical protein